MTAMTVVGVLLVITTWFVSLGALLALGALPSYLTMTISGQQQLNGYRSPASFLRLALWWGLGLLMLCALLLTLVTNLRSLSAWLLIGTLTAASMITTLVLLRLRTQGIRIKWQNLRPQTTQLMLTGTAITILIALAVTTLGPVTHYDAGLYQLGAALYSRDYGAVPGLANLFAPFGYSSAQTPLAAFFSSLPWEDNGFRLLNGFIAALVGFDLMMRLIQRLKTWGTYVMLLGWGLALSLLIPMGDFWIASPSVDTAVFLIGLTTTAYVADSLQGRESLVSVSITALTSTMLLALRPTTIVFALLSAGVAIATLFFQKVDGRRFVLWWVFGYATVAAIVQFTRDYVLSGWLLYPLSLFPLHVDWRASDPWALREATLGAARDPENLWEASSGWAWIPGWFARSTGTWEGPLLLGLLVLACAATIATRKRWHRQSTTLLGLSLLPALAASVSWFIASPPSFRFAWPFLFSIPILILGLALTHFHAVHLPNRKPRLGAENIAIAAVFLTLFASSVATLTLRSSWDTRTQSEQFAVGPFTATYVMSPLTHPDVVERSLPTGLSVQIPESSEQCWQVYPLCVPRIEESVGMRGSSISDGFENHFLVDQ